MMEKRSKYDTNPLDPDYGRRADDMWGAVRSAPETGEAARRTEGQGRVNTEAPTQRIEENRPYTSYPSVFIPPAYQPPTNVNPQAPPVGQPVPSDSSRAVAGIGLPERVCKTLPYAPFYIGLVAAAVELFIVPRKEAEVRFHAAQGLALHLAIIVISFFFTILGTITGSGLGGSLFRAAAFFYLIYSMFRVWKGRPHTVAPLVDAARWLDERIAPKKF